jgi:hypothetical protein
MKTLAALAVILSAATPALAQNPAMGAGSAAAYHVAAQAQAVPEATDPKRLAPQSHELAAGQFGYLYGGFRIEEIIDPKTAIVSFPGIYRGPYQTERVTALVSGFDTTGKADGSGVDDKIFFVVSGTTKRAYRTLFQLVVSVPTPEQLKAMVPKAQLRHEASERRRAEEEAKKNAEKQARLADKEGLAASKLRMAKSLLESNPEKARTRLAEIVASYPGTAAAKQAGELLKAPADQ